MASALNTPLVYLPGSKTPAPPLLTAEEVCTLLRMKPWKGMTWTERLLPWRANGRLKSMRIGRDVFFKLVDVLEFLDQQQEASE